MGGGRKSRNSAKTGDGGLKKQIAESLVSRNNKKSIDTDDMYNEVDRFTQEREQTQEDMIKFEPNGDDSSDNDGDDGKENVLDLGMAGSSEEESSDDSDSDQDDDDESLEKQVESSEDDSDDSDDEGISSENARTKILNWGKRKKDYYHGDTADLEIGQDFEEAELEEEAGREVQQLRWKEMEEDDFMPFATSKNDKKQTDTVEDTTTTTTTPLSHHRREKIRKLSSSDKRQFLEVEHEEFFPVVQFFQNSFVTPLLEEITPIANQLLTKSEQDNSAEEDNPAEAIGTTKEGLHYIHQKQMLLTGATLNLCTYLLFKCQNKDVKNHPILQRLNDFTEFADKLQAKVETPLGLDAQLTKLGKAVKLMDGQLDLTEDEESESSVGGESVDGEESMTPEITESIDNNDVSSIASSEETASSSDEEKDEELGQQSLLAEARFGVRPQDMVEHPTNKRKSVSSHGLDYGDDNYDEDDTKQKQAYHNLSHTMNTLAQKEDHKKKKSRPSSEGVDDDDEIERGLHMMNAMLGPGSDDDDDDMNESPKGDTNSSDEDEFYSTVQRKSLSKKLARQEKYSVAPKFPTKEPTTEGERAITQTIMKNRGLVAHKSKLNRNPRAKKREQYRKALIRRKGTVREVITQEASYGGEETGVKSSISRSRKLGVKR